MTTEHQTFLFTDMEASTAVKAVMPGADAAQRNQAFFDQILIPHRRRVVADLMDHGGRVVKTMGDGFFVVFTNPMSALLWSARLQESHRDDPIQTPHGPLKIRMALHHGKAVVDDNDLIGRDVDHCARLMELADGGQVLASPELESEVRNQLVEYQFYRHPSASLKGIGMVDIWELIYHGKSPQPVRTPRDHSEELLKQPVKLEIQTHDGHEKIYQLEKRYAVIGSAEQAQIRLQDPDVAERHAELYFNAAGDWSIHDSGGRGGIWVNGRRVRDRSLEPGDIVLVGGTYLSMMAEGIEPDPHADRAKRIETYEALKERLSADAGRLDFEVPKEIHSIRLKGEQLKIFRAFSKAMAKESDESKRLTEVCRFLTDEAFGAMLVMALRFNPRDQNHPVSSLCETEVSGAWKHYSNYFSLRLLEEVYRKKESVVAYDALGIVSRLCAGSHPVKQICLLATPFRNQHGHVDMLYCILPSDYGVEKWLTLTMMVVDQFHLVNHMIRDQSQLQSAAMSAYEREHARAIQNRTYPTQWQAPGLDVSSRIMESPWAGGDYVDLLSNEQGIPLVVHADAEGQGLDAAIMANMVQSVCQSFHGIGVSLPRMVQGLNQYISARHEFDQGLAMSALSFDPKESKFTYLNAGNPPLILLKQDGQVQLIASPSQGPLGITPGEQPVIEFTIEQGDCLFMFSDGLLSLPNESGERLGLERLAQLVQREKDIIALNDSATLSQHLFSQLKYYHGDAVCTDDAILITLMLRCG